MNTTSRGATLAGTILAVSMTTIDQTIVAICAPDIQTAWVLMDVRMPGGDGVAATGTAHRLELLG